MTYRAIRTGAELSFASAVAVLYRRKWGMRRMLALELPTEWEARLGRLAAQTGRGPADLVLQALAEPLDEIEDLAIAELRWKEHVKNGSEAIPLQEVMRRHDLAD